MRYYRALIVAFLALCLGVLTACSQGPTTREEVTSYDEILGTGLANKCPQLSETARGSIPIEPNQTYFFSDLCLEPQEYFVKEEPANKRQEAEFIAGKILTRSTSTLEQIRGEIKSDEKGLLTLIEKDGMDFQPVTVLLPGGEEVPFLFSIKELVASTGSAFKSINTSTDFKGEFVVPSYRGNVFLDPKGRGVASGYDTAVALPSQGDEEELARANIKRLEKGKGSISLQVSKIDSETGEIAGIFQSIQPSDTDLGAKEAKEVKVRGIFYAQLEPQA